MIRKLFLAIMTQVQYLGFNRDQVKEIVDYRGLEKLD